MDRKQSSHKLINERRNYFRVDDTVLMRVRPIDETSALANKIPRQFEDDLGYSLMHELQLIDQDNTKYLRGVAELSSDLEAFLKGLNKKIDIVAARLVDNEERAPDQHKVKISISEGGLSFYSQNQHAHDSYLALQLTILPSHHALILFCKVINCSEYQGGYTIALSFVHLKDADRQYIAKHIMKIQLAERRQQTNDE